MKNFAKTVSEQRKKKMMTQEELALRLGITPQAVSKWENGIGLPDVTLFPMLAEVLEISIDQLFGVEKSRRCEETFPPSFDGLAFIEKVKGRLCYSNKKMTEVRDGVVFFSDGSFAEMESGVVTNVGEGEIRVLAETEWSEFDPYVGGEVTTKDASLPLFDSLSLVISRKCNVRILPVAKGKQAISLRGNQALVERFIYEVKGGLLTVKVGDPNGNRNDSAPACSLNVFVPFEKGKLLSAVFNGSSEVAIEADFDDGTVTVNGSGTVSVCNFEKLCIRVNGCGEVHGKTVSETTKLRIAGSGSLALSHVSNPDIKISGSGDITMRSVRGSVLAQISGSGALDLGELQGSEMNAQVSGSGDFSCVGELDTLKVRISGSGAFSGGELTVREADLKINGSGEIELKRIKEKSIEKLSKSAFLKVSYRG